MIRAHRSGLSKAGKSIAELALQAYNEALLQLSVTNPISLRTAHSWLEITLSLWRDSPFVCVATDGQYLSTFSNLTVMCFFSRCAMNYKVSASLVILP